MSAPDTLKTQVLDALTAWIRQRPGLEFGNYGDVPSYRAEVRQIGRYKRDAETLLQAVRWRDSITGSDIIEASKQSFSGRLEIKLDADKVTIDYTTGQYWPTEYRKAAAAVLARCLWNYTREAMPASTGQVKRTIGQGVFRQEILSDDIDGLSPGDWMRLHMRKEFGSRLQRRWFN